MNLTIADTRARLAELLEDARARTLLLIAPVSEADLRAQHSPLMGPIVWDLGHIAHFEELWLLRQLDAPVRFGEMPGLFNPFEHPRATRGALELPTRSAALALLADVRRRVLGRLAGIELDADSPLLRDGYVYHMVLQHEYQHDETILQTLQLKQGEPYAAPRSVEFDASAPRRSGVPLDGMVRFPGGPVTIGTDDRTVAYDNERPAHTVELEPFRIDTTPVTNGAYAAFIADGGYRRRELWTDDGWAWRTESDARAPLYWREQNGRWHTRAMDRSGPIDPARPVCHVSFHEAAAYARWAGKRLPTEFEWEAAASVDPESGAKRSWPWGDETITPAHANVDQLAFDVAPVGTFERNVSPIGCHGLIGDVWEWTSSEFRGYPGFEAFPYPEYSEEFFGGEYRVLRGGSWATRAGAIRSTFRNWDYPIRRQIFSGFRCARDD